MKRFLVVALVAAVYACSPPGAVIGGSAPKPDVILHGGKVYTGDTAAPWAQAVGIRGNRIVAVGADASVLALAGPSTRRIDVGGRTIIPGINDTHVHLGAAAPIGAVVPIAITDFARGPLPGEMLDSIAALARRTPRGTWIRGDMGVAIRRSQLRRAALDSVAPEHPVILVATYGNGSMVNTRALRIMGIPESAADPVGGWYERDSGSKAITGLLDGAAQSPAWNAYFSSHDSTMVATLRDQARFALQVGITTLQHMSTLNGPMETQRLFAAAALPLRVRIIARPLPDNAAAWERLRGTRPAPLAHVSGVKYISEGTPIEQFALMRRAYPEREGWFGRLYHSPDEIRALLVAALTRRDQLALHVVGDSTAAMVFRLMSELAADSVWRPLRVRFEHAVPISREFIGESVRRGIILSQPRVPPLWRAWHDAGLVFGYGSDGQPGNPWLALAEVASLPPAVALPRETALRYMTWGSAYSEMAERDKGSLAPGMLADVAVLSQDVFKVPVDQLRATTSVLTIVDGVVRHDAGLLAVR